MKQAYIILVFAALTVVGIQSAAFSQSNSTEKGALVCNATPAEHATPATPAIPGVTPAIPATPAEPPAKDGCSPNTAEDTTDKAPSMAVPKATEANNNGKASYNGIVGDKTHRPIEEAPIYTPFPLPPLGNKSNVPARGPLLRKDYKP